ASTREGAFRCGEFQAQPAAPEPGWRCRDHCIVDGALADLCVRTGAGREQRMKPIVTLTLNPAIDGAAEAQTVRPIRKVRTWGERYDPGGGGINVARVVQELGGEALAIYLAGGV